MKTKGARQDREDLRTLTDSLRLKAKDALEVGNKTALLAASDPKAWAQLWETERRLLEDMIRLIEQLDLFVTKQVEPYMERAAPRIETRVAELEQQIDALLARIRALEQRDIDPPQFRLYTKTRRPS